MKLILQISSSLGEPKFSNHTQQIECSNIDKMKFHPLELSIMVYIVTCERKFYEANFISFLFFSFFKFSSQHSLDDDLQPIPCIEYITFKFISKKFKITLSSAHRSLKSCFPPVQKLQSPQYPSSVTNPKTFLMLIWTDTCGS